MKLLNKTSKGFFIGFVAIVAGSIAIAFIAVYFSPEARFEREMASLQEQYANDTYGGDTPEETLELFIQALEDGNVELASKYFVVEKQTDWLDLLKKIKSEGLLNNMISDLNREKYEHIIGDKQVNFSIANDKNEIALTILLSLEVSGKWKILDM
ncbi:MAG: hypothetical protein ISR98_01105 [Parcubacteria group bacterium]|nr:hypothetical protein [Parcubacteria group bacterium]